MHSATVVGAGITPARTCGQLSDPRGTLVDVGKSEVRIAANPALLVVLFGLLSGLAFMLIFGLTACGGAASSNHEGRARSPSKPIPASPHPTANSQPPGATAGSGNPAARSPVDNSRGLLPGLAPVPASQRPAALALIDQLTTKGRGAKTGYSRAQFGRSWTDSASGVPYAFNGCYTRDDILRRDLTATQVRPGTNDCVVVAGLLADPYTGADESFRKDQAADIQIDHVFPLSLAWQMGASGWDVDRRTRFANDPLNLLAVDGVQNEIKKDSGPASWLPPNKSVRCAYSVRFAQVALAYQLAVPVPDKEMMARLCAGST